MNSVKKTIPMPSGIQNGIMRVAVGRLAEGAEAVDEPAEREGRQDDREHVERQLARVSADVRHERDADDERRDRDRQHEPEQERPRQQRSG